MVDFKKVQQLHANYSTRAVVVRNHENGVGQKSQMSRGIFSRIALVITAILFAFTSFAQDQIHTHKGEVIECKVIEMGDKTIKYKYDGDELVISISKNLVSQVKFANGRTQKVTDKIIIRGEKDWEKVVITNLESDIEGLTRAGEVMTKAGGTVFTNQGKTQKKAMIKLKKEAAAKGCHIVLILTTTGKNSSWAVSGRTRSSVTGVLYKY